MSMNLYDSCFFFQAEDGIRDLVRSRGLGDVYKRQGLYSIVEKAAFAISPAILGIALAYFGFDSKAAVQLSLIHI